MRRRSGIGFISLATEPLSYSNIPLKLLALTFSKALQALYAIATRYIWLVTLLVGFTTWYLIKLIMLWFLQQRKDGVLVLGLYHEVRFLFYSFCGWVCTRAWCLLLGAGGSLLWSLGRDIISVSFPIFLSLFLKVFQISIHVAHIPGPGIE